MFQGTQLNLNQDNYSTNSYASSHLFLKTSSRLLKIYPEDILWIEAFGDYVNIHTGNERFTIHSTMKGIEKKLSTDEFVRVHRSFIVRLDKISTIEGKVLVVNKKLIPISNSYRKPLIDRLNLL